MFTFNPLLRAAFFVGVLSYFSPVFAQDVPLVASYSMEKDAANPQKLLDSGPLHLDGTVGAEAALVAGGVRGGGLQFSGSGSKSSAKLPKNAILNRIGSPISVSFWVKPDKLPKGGDAALLTKRDAAWQPSPFEIDISPDGSVGVNLNNGQKWSSFWRPKTFKVGEWTHIAFTHAPDGEAVVYVDGAERKRLKVGGSLASNDNAFVLGWMQNMDFPGGNRAPFVGMLDEVHLYSAVLTPEQITADKDGTLVGTRAAAREDFAAPTHYVALRLGRYDLPLVSATGRGFVNAKAVRQSGPDALDWPQFTLKGEPIWEKDGDDGRFLPLRDGDAARSLFQRPDDETIAAGNHWLRPVKGFMHRDVVSSDRTARTDENEYQLWAFPMLIRGAGENDVRDVALKYDGQTIYQNAGPLRSLTLLLPQNEGGKPYEISVTGRSARFEAGLQPIVPGNPKNVLIPVNLTLPGTPKITISNAPPAFGAQKEWDADLRKLGLFQAVNSTTSVLDARRVEAAKTQAGGADAPQLLAFYAFEPDKTAPQTIADLGPLNLDGQLRDGANFAAGGQRDNTLQLGGGKARASFKIKALNEPLKQLSLSFWARLDELPKGGKSAILVSKRPAPYSTTPFSLQVAPDGALSFNGHNGAWQTFNSKKKLAPGEWHHIALTLQTGDAARLYFDGEAAGSKKLGDEPLTANNDPLVFGYEENADFPGGGRSGFVGAFDEAKIYLSVLTPEQIAADRARTLVARAPEGLQAAPKVAPGPQNAKPTETRAISWRDRIGIEVARSPVAIYSVSLPHGMSGGHFLKSAHGPGPEFFDKGKKFPGNAGDYADYLAQTGYDRVFEQAGDNAFNEVGGSFDTLAQALKSRGIGLGLTPDVDWKRPFLTHPNVAFLAYNLPDWHAPLYRSLQLAAQRLNGVGNFAGVSIGADGGNGYVPFWDWAPPNPGTPWSEAFENQFGAARPVEAKATGGTATTRQMLDYIAQHDKTANQYGYFARAVSEVNPAAPTTTGSYGPGGVGARGGWSWATNPGREIFAGLGALQVYDWDETLAHKPLYNVTSLDRLQSYFPDKPAWALMDDFYLKFGRESRQRAYALALTRGVTAIGPNWIAQPSGAQAKPEKVADQKELHAQIHRWGGAFAGTRPNASIGILYVNSQSLLRRFNQTGDNKISDAELLAASHDGKTREALFMCLAAGWPAKLITPDEWKRGLPADMKAVLLTGLTPTDGTWNWWDSLETQLKTFAQNGGKLLLDNESMLPAGVEGTKTGLKIRGYITQGDGVTSGASPDKTPLLLARNAENLPLLRAAMQGVAAPVAVSDDPTIWAVPHTTGDVQFVTVVNNAVEAGQSTEKAFNPKTATLKWNTARPIYDLKSARKLAPESAKTLDLTRDAFQILALPPQEITAPSVKISRDDQGFYGATAQIGAGMRGVPVEFTIEKDGQKATIFGASGVWARLPIFEKGIYFITATELLSQGSVTLQWEQKSDFNPSPTQNWARSAAGNFASSKGAKIIIALTPDQQKDPEITALAQKLAAFYVGKNRKVETRTLAPGEVVTGLQSTRAMQKYPQWQTVEADLILLGGAAQNPLIFDQMRGGLLDGSEGIHVTYSPFVGEYWALNIVGDDVAKLTAEVEKILR